MCAHELLWEQIHIENFVRLCDLSRLRWNLVYSTSFHVFYLIPRNTQWVILGAELKTVLRSLWSGAVTGLRTDRGVSKYTNSFLLGGFGKYLCVLGAASLVRVSKGCWYFQALIQKRKYTSYIDVIAFFMWHFFPLASCPVTLMCFTCVAQRCYVVFHSSFKVFKFKSPVCCIPFFLFIYSCIYTFGFLLRFKMKCTIFTLCLICVHNKRFPALKEHFLLTCTGKKCETCHQKEMRSCN